jgi:prolyl-tRNA synthetase
VQAVIVPIFNDKNKQKILKEAERIKALLESISIDTEIDSSEKRPGEKFFYWEMKGVPFRLEIGEKELSEKKLTLFTRDTKQKTKISFNNLEKEIMKLGEEYDKRLLKKADNSLKNSVQGCQNKEQIRSALENKKIARFSFCSIEKEGAKCAEYIEKALSARVMGSLANKKEKPEGKCIICNKKANEVVYAGKSY